MNNIIIDTPERLDNDIEEFKIDAVEDEKNFTSARLRVCRDVESNVPVLFYTQDLHRNFRKNGDPFSKRSVIRTFTGENAMASVDTALEKKFKDTVLAHQRSIRDYSPLTDIHSNEMSLFLDEETATYLSDVGVNIDGISEDFIGIESVSATPFMEDIANDVFSLKEQLSMLNSELASVKSHIADEIGIANIDESVLANHKVSDALVQKYLSVMERINTIKQQLGEASEVVFSETKTRIQLPHSLENISIAM